MRGAGWVQFGKEIIFSAVMDGCSENNQGDVTTFHEGNHRQNKIDTDCRL